MWLTPNDPKMEFVSQEELRELREKEARLRALEAWLGERLLHLFDAHQLPPKRKP